MDKEREFPAVFAIVDTETTGLRAATGRIIDIAVIRVEHGKVTKTFQSLVNPGGYVSPMSFQLTGINPEELSRAPSFEEVIGEILPMFEGAVFVAHNAAFDYSFFKTECRRLGINFEALTLCSVQLSRKLYPDSRSHNLDSVMNRHGIICADRHRAYPDADIVRQFIEQVREERAEEFQTVVEYLLYGKEKKMERKVLKELPVTSGVYFFYGKDRELLYVGKSKHIRTRVRSHFSNKQVQREQALCEQTDTVEVWTTHGELSALLLEASLIKQELPHYNRATRHRSELVSLVETVDEKGYKRGVLGRTQHIVPSTNVLGIFRSLVQAKDVLRTVSREHKLCDTLLGMDKTVPCFGTQLGTCLGACAGRELAAAYNARFDQAFKARRMRTWPYKGVIAIEEKGEEQGSGTVFFVDNWVLRGSYTFTPDSMQQFLPTNDSFSHDTYKILARYILNKINRRNIRELTQKEFEAAVRETAGEFGRTVVYE